MAISKGILLVQYLSHANIQGPCLLCGLFSPVAHTGKHLVALVSVSRHEHVLCPLSAHPPACLCVRPATTASALHTGERASRYPQCVLLTDPAHHCCLPRPRLPLAPVSGSWIRPSSRWSVGWEVDTAFIGQPGPTNHRPVSSQMPSGAPGARNPPAHAASALPHCTTTRTTARVDYGLPDYPMSSCAGYLSNA